MINHEVIRLTRLMSKRQRLAMLRDVVANMAERNNAEEIAAFMSKECGGDDLEIARSYAKGLD